MDSSNRFIKFIESATGFDVRTKLRLILIATKAKPATFVALKISSANLAEKTLFETHLRENNIIFEVSRPKSYEEIDQIQKDSIVWKMKGTWYGYDLFQTEDDRDAFRTYVSLLEKGSHAAADKVAGKLYGYPSCCIRTFMREQDLSVIARKYSCYDYFAHRAQVNRNFPFCSHTPCSAKCAPSKRLNAKYEQASKAAKSFFREFTAKKRMTCQVLFDSESDLFVDGPSQNRSIWLEKDGHQYRLITLIQPPNKYVLMGYLTRHHFERGSVGWAKITIQHDIPSVEIEAITDFLPNMEHKRKFLVE